MIFKEMLYNIITSYDQIKSQLTQVSHIKLTNKNVTVFLSTRRSVLGAEPPVLERMKKGTKVFLLCTVALMYSCSGFLG